MIVLGLLFLASRWLLVQTSYAAHAHWEEPVFLFSGIRLLEEGLGSVWDYQDDLSHGGSLPLLVLAAGAVAAFGPSMMALKAVVIAWSTAGFLLLLSAVRNAWGSRATLVCGVLLLILSPNLARLQVTLVGSHPEALLPAAAALWWFAKNRGTSEPLNRSSFLLGMFAANAIWMSITLAPWMVALLIVGGLGTARRWQQGVSLLLGALLGGAPWIYQNLYLRPHGATLWVQRLGRGAGDVEGPPPLGGMLAFLPESWGLGEAGAAVTVLAVVAWLALASALRLEPLPAQRSPRFGLALLLSSVLTALSLALAHLRPVADEGYYFARFFAPLQVQLLLVAGLAVDAWAVRLGGWLRILASIGAVAAGLYAFLPLLYLGGEVPQQDVLLRRGCLVFGNAEYARSGDARRAVLRLLRLSDTSCRDLACTGLGWALADEYVATASAEGAQRALEAAGTTSCAHKICGGLHFVLARRPGLPQARRSLPEDLRQHCP